MIDLGLSEEFLSGYKARLNNEPFDGTKSDDWKMGWLEANQSLKW